MGNNTKYLFVIDIDGTLINTGDSEIKKNIVDEIENLKSKGHIFTISTGRNLNKILNIKYMEIFDYISVLMGSGIYHTATKSWIKNSNPLNLEETKKLIEYLSKNNLFWAYKDDCCEKTLSDNKQEQIRFEAQRVDESEYIKDLNEGNIKQLLFRSHLPENVKTEFKTINFFDMPDNYSDASNISSSKANTIKFFKENFPDYTIVAIGDSDNDIPMLETADISIAMGNAKEKIKNICTFTTKDINDNGLIYAFKNILKI